jgi:hypothetical protein
MVQVAKEGEPAGRGLHGGAASFYAEVVKGYAAVDAYGLRQRAGVDCEGGVAGYFGRLRGGGLRRPGWFRCCLMSG